MAGCVFIDVEKLMTDIKVANVKFNDGISPSGRLGTIGLSFSTFHDAKKNSQIQYVINDYPSYDGYGVMKIFKFNAICDLFKLKKDKYIPKKIELPIKVNDKPVYATKGCLDVNNDNIRLRILLEDVSCIKKDLNEFKEYKYGIQNSSVCLSHIDNKLDTLIKAINTLGKVEAQNMEYLKNIADGIQTMNDKYNKPSAYIRK